MNIWSNVTGILLATNLVLHTWGFHKKYITSKISQECIGSTHNNVIIITW